MTPQEINEAVHLKLDAMKPSIHVGETVVLRGGALSLPIPDYCGDIKAAWEIVEAGYLDVVMRHSDGKWSSEVLGQVNLSEKADTAPMAICLAFLKLP